jgi:archaeosine-15-forming tRNA-guanine transglycosylase
MRNTLRHVLCSDGIYLSLSLQNGVLYQTMRGAELFYRCTDPTLYRQLD